MVLKPRSRFTGVGALATVCLVRDGTVRYGITVHTGDSTHPTGMHFQTRFVLLQPRRGGGIHNENGTCGTTHAEIFPRTHSSAFVLPPLSLEGVCYLAYFYGSVHALEVPEYQTYWLFLVVILG